jgi:hypothetical protein
VKNNLLSRTILKREYYRWRNRFYSLIRFAGDQAVSLLRKGATMQRAREQIKQAVLAWEGVTAHLHRFGGTEYHLGRREIGHVHGDYLVDIPFPKKVRDEIVAGGQAEPHHILPDSGWISFYLREPADIERAISLFRQSFELAVKQRQKQA